MRSTTAAGRVLAVGLMVVFSLALAGQSAWGTETSTSASPDKQGACSYNKNPGAVSLAKPEVEGAGVRKERLGKARGQDIAHAESEYGKCMHGCKDRNHGCGSKCMAGRQGYACRAACHQELWDCEEDCWNIEHHGGAS